ncbi:MAG: carboxypeptidase-like regulatory domain-containing protein [Alphaproteobacteria bacterium]
MKLNLGFMGMFVVVPALTLFGQEGMSAMLTGRVATGNGQPIPGVLVSLFSADKNRKETVYTNAEGRYALRTAFTGALTMRANGTASPVRPPSSASVISAIRWVTNRRANPAIATSGARLSIVWKDILR